MSLPDVVTVTTASSIVAPTNAQVPGSVVAKSAASSFWLRSGRTWRSWSSTRVPTSSSRRRTRRFRTLTTTRHRPTISPPSPLTRSSTASHGSVCRSSALAPERAVRRRSGQISLLLGPDISSHMVPRFYTEVSGRVRRRKAGELRPARRSHGPDTSQ